MERDMTEITKYWPAEQTEAGIREAAAVLAAGGIIAFPTETVYGLGGDARSTSAVEKIFAAKGRPSDNPLIVHLAAGEDVHSLAGGVTVLEQALIDAFWPGPLTLVLPVKKGAVSALVTAGLDTVAVRVPEHKVARELIKRSGCPIAAPSANRSGRPSPTLARHVLEDLNGKIDGVLDGGATGVGLESTVVRVMGNEVHILRPGGITKERLQFVVGKIAAVIVPSEHISAAQSETNEEQWSAPRSPGVKYAHYAPQGEMILVSGHKNKLAAIVQAKADEAASQGRRVAVLSCAENAALYRADAVFDCGSHDEPVHAAHSLYAYLRECDERGFDFIVAEGYPEYGIGAAVMNRLRKAAGGREIIVN
jgi:L-threonylcarbamoyladenylate synthase